MKKLTIIFAIILLGLTGNAQVSDIGELRVADATTTLDRNIPVGTKIYNIATGEYWVATAGIASTETLTTASASLTLLNDAGTDDQTASEVDITDAGNHYTGTNVEDALQEVGDSIAAIETNVSTQLSTGTVTGTTYGITSDGSVDDVVLPAANDTDAGLMTAADKTKLDGIEEGAEVNYTMITESFEEASGTATAHNLSQTALTSNGCRVSFNGATLDPSDYTFTSTTITVNTPVFQFDKVVITYTY